MAQTRSSPPDGGFAEFTRRLIVTALVALIAVVLFVWHHVLLVLFGAALVAVMLTALAEPIRKRTPLDAAWALGAAVLGLFLIIAGVTYFVGAQVGQQLGQLGAALPSAWTHFERELTAYDSGHWLMDRLHDAPSRGVDGLAPLAGWLARTAQSGVAAVAEVVIVIIGGVYLAAQPNLYLDGLLALVPPPSRPRAQAGLDEMGLALRRWLLGTGVAMLAMGVLTTIGAALLGLPAPLALGLLSGLAEFVPIVGAAVSAIPGLLLAATDGPTKVLWTLVFYVAVHQFEGHVLIPLIQRRVVAVPPALTLFSVLGFGVLLGPLGVVFATPLAVVLMVLVKHLYLARDEGLETSDPKVATKPVGARGKV